MLRLLSGIFEYPNYILLPFLVHILEISFPLIIHFVQLEERQDKKMVWKGQPIHFLFSLVFRFTIKAQRSPAVQ